MIELKGTVVGAHVQFFYCAVPHRKHPVNVLCFGLTHLVGQKYNDLFRKPDPGGRTYVPRWLEKLAASSGETSDTLILLEFPPFTPESIEAEEIERTTGDFILNHSLMLLRPFFTGERKALEDGWILDGCDLRYRFQTRGVLVTEKGEKKRIFRIMKHPGPRDDYRSQTLHSDLSEDLGHWVPTQQELQNYYYYLTKMSNDKGAYDKFVRQVISVSKTRDPKPKWEIFAQAASRCRAVYDQVLPDLKKSIISYLSKKLYEKAEKIKDDNREIDDELERLEKIIKKQKDEREKQKLRGMREYAGKPESIAFHVIKYGLAEHLMNLYLLGNIFQPDSDFNNVVIVAGKDHISVIGEFLSSLEGRLKFQALAGTNKQGGIWGLTTQLLKPIKLT